MLFFGKLSLLGLFVFQSLASADCLCLCSIFHTTGGEVKLCAKEPYDGIRCPDWLYPVAGISDSKSCSQLGENFNECKGYKKTDVRKIKWVEDFGGRYHSCRIIASKKK